ncbi:MAG: hypothetical protein HY646_06450 [Acidobacteria bacterium]|nr:hypothetical protein [Acidobacteriota bacterium]
MKDLILIKLPIFLMVFLFLSSTAMADLINNLDGTITQIRSDGNKLMWMQDANYAKTSGFDPNGQITQAAAISWASSLTFAGYTGLSQTRIAAVAEVITVTVKWETCITTNSATLPGLL